MSYIDIEMDEKELRLEYDRKSVIEMEKMGYNALNPGEKVYTTLELLVHGALLKHQPSITKTKAEKVCDFIVTEYGIPDAVQNLNEMLQEVYVLEGKSKKKLERKGIKVQKTPA